MKGRPKSVVIRRQALPRPTTSSYNQQSTSSLSKRSVVSPHYKKAQMVQTEPNKNEKNSVLPRFYSVVKNPKLEALRESVEESGKKYLKNINDNDLSLLLAHTREYQQTCAAERKYEKANDAKELLELIKEEMKSRQETIKPDEEAIEKAKNEKKQIIEHYNQVLQNCDEKFDERQKAIEEKQAKAMELFENEWRDLMPRKYQKSSSSLLQLKEIEKNLILTGDYMKAKEAQERIQQIQKDEIELRQIDLNEDYANAKTELKKKQKNEIDVFMQARKEHIETLNYQKKADMKMMDNRMNVASKKSIGTRCPRSKNTSNTDNYATSFQHIAKDKNFGIDPLLPKLGPPSDKRQYRIKNSKPKRICVNAPRAYLPRNDRFFDSSEDGVFETSLKQNQIKGTEDNNEYDNDNEDDQKHILQDQIKEISKSLNEDFDNEKLKSDKSDKNEINDTNESSDIIENSDHNKNSDKNENIDIKENNDKNYDKDNENNDADNKNNDKGGILENSFASIASSIMNDSNKKSDNTKSEEKTEETKEEKKESQPFHMLISSIVGDIANKDDEKNDN